MNVSRRDFLKYCAVSASALGLCPVSLKRLEAALSDSGAPTLVWLHGSGCQGDSVSFLNLFANLAPVGTVDTKDVLINHVNLAYHTVVMASAGETAVTMAAQAKRRGGYVLVCEGGVPTAFDGHACNIMTVDGQEKTYQEVVLDFAADAAAVVCVGTCACYGGIPMAPPNPTAVVPVKQAISSIDKGVINIPGCPSHPNWVAWAVVQLILGNDVTLDANDRPTALFGNNPVDPHTLNVHDNCPRNPSLGNAKATTFGQDNLCLEDLGCRGPVTFADCPNHKWNGYVDENGDNVGTNWCVDCNGLCFGCVEPDFPGGDFYT
jgi:NiFe hydrogenase small subunit HydA